MLKNVNQVIQVSATHVLHHHVKIVSLNEVVITAHHVWVVHALQQLGL